MTPELVTEYKHILGTVLNVMVDEQLDYVRTMLERIDDSADELRSALARDELPPVPPHWISIMRVLRLGIALRAEAQQNYDTFVQSYQELSGIGDRDEDQTQLIKELGDVLYSTDDIFGDMDRVVQKLLRDTHRLLATRYGMQAEPSEEFYRSTMTVEDRAIVEVSVRALMSLSQKMLENLHVMRALERVRRLIMRPASAAGAGEVVGV